MMKVFFISNGIWEFDGRLRELIKVASELGEIKYITRVKNPDVRMDSNHIMVRESSYFHFIVKAVIQGLRSKDMDILFVDNRKAIIPALLLKLFRRPRKTILDVRELYLSKEVRHLTGKIGCFFEGIMIKKADIVICANIYRAELMREYYRLSTTPLVYENLRSLKYGSEFDCNELNSKYNDIFSKDSFKIISTSGCSVSRTNDFLVEAAAKLGNDYELLLVGGGTEKDKSTIQSIIKKNNMTNVHIIEKVGENDLKYLISKSHLGIVNYHQKDMNNRYCASGKLYEFLFEGLPVVTTENKPLLDLVEKNEIGVSDNHYFEGIKRVKNDYAYYKLNVNKFISNTSIEINNKELKNQIICCLEKKIVRRSKM